MIQCVFAVYDKAAEAFLPPFFLPNKGMAVRTFGDCIKDTSHAFSRNPADYNLMYLGKWNNVDGTFELSAAGGETVITGLSVKQYLEKDGK